MKRILLYGFLRERFGKEYVLDVASPREAFHALSFQVEGFEKAVLGHRAGFRAFSGSSNLNEKSLGLPCGDVIRLVPVVAGAKSELGQILMGAALVVASVYMPQMGAAFAQGGSMAWATSAVATIGWATTLGGVSRLLANQTEYTGTLSTDETPSYVFSGPKMTKGQGNPVPVLLGGPLRIGGSLISSGVSPNEWPKNGLANAAPDEAGTRGGNGDTAPFAWAYRKQE